MKLNLIKVNQRFKGFSLLTVFDIPYYNANNSIHLCYHYDTDMRMSE